MNCASRERKGSAELDNGERRKRGKNKTKWRKKSKMLGKEKKKRRRLENELKREKRDGRGGGWRGKVYIYRDPIAEKKVLFITKSNPRKHR